MGEVRNLASGVGSSEVGYLASGGGVRSRLETSPAVVGSFIEQLSIYFRTLLL